VKAFINYCFFTN